MNRPPVITGVDDVSVMEGDIITLDIEANDPDGDELSIEYSFPFDERGVWKTEIGDAGTYSAKVVASDGERVAEQEFAVEVTQVNTAPSLRTSVDIEAEEGDTIFIDVQATDREGDELIISCSCWMD